MRLWRPGVWGLGLWLSVFRLRGFGFEVISSVYRRIKKEAWLLNLDVRWIIKVQDGGSRLEDVSFSGVWDRNPIVARLRVLGPI